MKLSSALLALALLACHPADAIRARTDDAVTAALAGPTRTADETARDVYRHPRETLAFFGLRDDMRVVELWAPEGYYTAILAPILKDRGHLTATYLDPHGDFQSLHPKLKQLQIESTQKYLARLDRDPAAFGAVERVAMKAPVFAFGPDASADLVLTFRNVHNWVPEHYEDDVFAAAFRVLRHGGVLGVTDHRGAPGETAQQIEDTGYIPVDQVIALAKKAGFELAGASEINANPKDTKDYPDGVWSLPPTLALKDADRAKYLAIGESDRMTLKFVKP